MMKGRTASNLQLNRSTKNGKRDQKPQKKNGAKRSSEQERLKTLEAKQESKVSEAVSVTTTEANDDAVNGSSESHHESESSEVAEKDADDDDKEEESKDTAPLLDTCEGGNEDKRADLLVKLVEEDASDNDISSGSEKEENEDEEALKQKVESLETRIEKLEEELRDVAALEISLYSVVPDHSSLSHKLHTPARRISRLYIHACKHWSQGQQATVARNTVSGLILAAKSCGNDVPRLTFWLSNIITLRGLTSHAFTQISESNGSETFTASLEKVEFWLFSRIVESIWWQIFTPHMQSSENGDKTNEKGSFSISLWQNAFKVALSRLCPMRGEGHECGCLPILSKMVMEKCIARVDVAMFNAILRESEHQIPTDPVSDPIIDSKVLPIPAGDLSFGSGAQLKNAIGNWCRCLSEVLDMNTIDSVEEDETYFSLLNELSDLLMLPKDMLIDLTIREEVCPSISLPLIKRILCNFTPDEFCPDHVPGSVLEELNAESISEQKLSGFSFPYAASPVSYIPPSSTNVAEKIPEVGRDISRMSRNASMIQRKGYTSDEELDELDSPLTFVIDKVSASLCSGHTGKVKQKDEQVGEVVANVRYELLREVWSM
ncbi:unnamed protein product [Eruca vesicaria subsp. sativa]|uniref:Dilute domain-containing protein n=1 Tax=Eruca vesicaria subsp. sativa TaxID=29727 RepID=A0ABC8JR19_ERUVS|nr:unnamed protein product [Eruca vesicaria subsp. sativa]